MTTSATLALQVGLGDPFRAASLMQRPGVVRVGHFRLLSGAHSDTFVAFSGVATDPTALDEVVGWLLPTVASWSPTTVIAPSTAGVGLGSTLARQLEVPLQLVTLNADGRADGLLGAYPLDGERALLVNDVVTTGQGLQALAGCVASRGAAVVGAAWFLSRTDINVGGILNAPTAHIATAGFVSWEPEACPHCRSGLRYEDALDLN